MEVSAGSLSIGVSYHGFPIYTETKDLCQQTACPVKKGPVSVQLEEPFPVITPPVSLPPAPCTVLYVQLLALQVTLWRRPAYLRAQHLPPANAVGAH